MLEKDVKNFEAFDFDLRIETNQDMKLLVQTPYIFGEPEFGNVININLDKKFGFIKVNSWGDNIYFKESDYIGLFNQYLVGKYVRFNPVIHKERIYAVKVEIYNNNDEI